MEPMNLGSPASPPSSPAQNPNFLPSFLMGDPQPTSASSPNPMISPGRSSNKTVTFSKTPQTIHNPTNLRQKLFNQSINDYSSQSTFTSPVVEKGPPKQGLFDTIESKPKSPILHSTMHSFNENSPFSPHENFSMIGNESLNYSCNVNTINDGQSFINSPQYVERINTLWVTVFGFPPSMTSLAIAKLNKCGVIVDKKFPTQGNWVHIKFSSVHEVSRALLFNGKMLSNWVMLGVILYHNKDEAGNKENDVETFSSPIRARSLRNSILQRQDSNAVVIPQNVPQKSTGLVTKAMEYMFGW